MVVVEGRRLNLHHHHHQSLPTTTTNLSLLYDPTSLSLALMHSDSSFSLYPFLSPFPLSSSAAPPSPPPPPPTPTIIHPPSSSATFLSLQTQDPNSTPRVLFLVSSPHLGGASLLFRFWILNPTTHSFSRARVICNQPDFNFDENKLGLVFRINHGVAIKLVGSINVFAMYSISNAKIWVFAVKLAADHADGVTMKLMKCAVIDCSLPVFSISVSLGFLILGEENGIRVFPLRPLVKGPVKRHHHKLEGNHLNLRNGGSNRPINGVITRGNHSDYARLKSVKLRQESKEGEACFVPFMSKEDDYKDVPLKTVKAISIQVLSPYKFLILDSVGDLHLLCLSNSLFGSEMRCQMKKLILSMKVQSFALLPDISASAHTVWLSDGHHTVHMMALSEVDSSEGESEGKDKQEMLIQNSVTRFIEMILLEYNFLRLMFGQVDPFLSVTQAIFTGEKIQEIIPFAANAILILGQANNIFAYAIS